VNPTALGLIAGSLTSIAAIPQLVKTIRTRHARDISIWQPLLLAIGISLWLIYGVLIHDLPLVLANIIPLICNIMLTILKVRYRENDVVTD
jgi:MtN3 and saliva related transmembrane protein